MESALENELEWRKNQWEKLKTSSNWPEVSSEEIRHLDLYAGQAGVYRDAKRTSKIVHHGVTVSIRNTSGKYTDEITDDRLIYSYPNTSRKGQDAAEIQSLKNAMTLNVPIFVISDLPNGRRNIRLGWVEGCEDVSKCILVKLDSPPKELVHPELLLAKEFHAKEQKKIQVKEIKVRERDKLFKFNAMAIYKGTCALTDVSVERMLEAAHVVPVADNGSDHPLNSLLLNVAVHRAFDAHLWAIEPDTLKLATLKAGPSLDKMKITHSSLRHLDTVPHQDALELRWKKFLKISNEKFEIAS